jgi:lipopolysaccharide/colanic/teichoic acid biosynthesis glycosyltransferase
LRGWQAKEKPFLVALEEVNEGLFREYIERRAKFDEVLERVMDIFFGLVGVVLLAFAFFLIAPAIKLTSSGPIFYTQKRVGKNGIIFTLYKFRTMVEGAEKEGPQWTKEKDERVTRIGRILRNFHLDELPQAVNLLKGDLSLVGPRPERPEFTKMLEREIPHYHLRHLVKPGIFGWAQLNFPYGDSIEDAREKLKYDLYYIKHRSLVFDLLIVLRSLKIILFAKGQ